LGPLVSFRFVFPERLSLFSGSKLFLAGLPQRLYFRSQLSLFGCSLLGFLFELLSQRIQLRQPAILFFGVEPLIFLETLSFLGDVTAHGLEPAPLMICSHSHFRFKRKTFMLGQARGFFLNLYALTRFRKLDYFLFSPLARSLGF